MTKFYVPADKPLQYCCHKDLLDAATNDRKSAAMNFSENAATDGKDAESKVGTITACVSPLWTAPKVDWLKSVAK